MIEIKITADSFSDMVKQLGGAVHMFIPVPTPEMDPKTPTIAVVDTAITPEVVDPPKKPSRAKKTQTIEGTVNPTTASPAPAAEQTEQQTTDAPSAEPAPTADEKPALDFEQHIRPAVLKYVNDCQDPKDPESKSKLFKALVAEFGVAKTSDIPADKYQAVLDSIAAKRKAAGV